MKYFTLFLIVWIGLLVRLNLPYREIWYDEAFTARITDNSYKDIIKLSAKDLHPPLYYLVVKPFKPYIRVPSLIFGLGTIVMAYLLADKLTNNKRKSLLAGLVVAWNPFLIAYSNEARSYSMLAFLFLLLGYFAVKAYKEQKYLGLSMVVPLILLTHYVGLLVLPILVLFLHKKAFVYLLPTVLILWFLFPSFTAKHNKPTWFPPINVVTAGNAVESFTLGYKDADTNKATFDRYFIGFFALSLVVIILVLPNWLSILYMGICIGVMICYQPVIYGYKDFAYQADNVDRQVVMADATEYITVSYYSNKIKLQEGDWSSWVVITDKDIYDKSQGNLYLVNNGPISGWGCDTKFGKYCVYEWN